MPPKAASKKSRRLEQGKLPENAIELKDVVSSFPVIDSDRSQLRFAPHRPQQAQIELNWTAPLSYPSKQTGWAYLNHNSTLFDGVAALPSDSNPGGEPLAQLQYGKRIWADQDRKGPFYVLWTRVTHPLDRFLKTTDFEDTAFVSDNSQCCIGSDQHTEGLGSV